MAHSNRLGDWLRERRRVLGYSLTDVHTRTEISLSYLSRIQSGQLTDGPSDDRLRELARSLGGDVAHLKQLRDADRSEAEKTSVPPSARKTAESRDEQQLLALFRSLPSTQRGYALAQVALLKKFTTDSRVPAEVELMVVGKTTVSPVEAELHAVLARDYLQMGIEYRNFERWEEALGAFETAERLLLTTENVGLLGLAQYHIANTHRAVAQNPDLPQRSQILTLQKAAQYFALADQAFQRTDSLEDAAAERVGENLVNWAKVDDFLFRLYEDEGKRAAYLKSAHDKRLRARGEFESWIRMLESRTVDELPLADDLTLKAEAHHRVAFLHRTLAYQFLHDADDLGKYGGVSPDAAKEGIVHHRKECLYHYRQARILRRQITLLLKTGGKFRWLRALNRLSNVHQETGDAIYQCVAVSPRMFEAALWHFKVAERLNVLSESDRTDPAQVRHLRELTEVLLDLDVDIGEAKKKRLVEKVAAEVASMNFETLEYPEPDEKPLLDECQ